uniref:Calpain catalytic domain-containing protein n=1 Tax=Loxodonta africana TaxID=9785 RepID=G3TGT3_LOXAF
FQFWQCGQWVDVVVDDRLPVLHHLYLLVYSHRDNNEFWPCLLEKAYAKLHGSYFYLHGGHLPDALVDLTNSDLYSSPSNLVVVVRTAAWAGSLLAWQYPRVPTGKDDVVRNGLVSHHTYTVTGAEQIQCRRGWEDKIICLWNAGAKPKWRGCWSDGCGFWKNTHGSRKGQLHENKEDGEFWISCQDFQNNFSCLSCNQTPISLDRGNTLHERWSEMMFKNQGIQGNSAEGPQRNPQFFFFVEEPMEGPNVIVSFTVMLQCLLATDKEIPLNFQVFKPSRGRQNLGETLPPLSLEHGSPFIERLDRPIKQNETKGAHLPRDYIMVISSNRNGIIFIVLFLNFPQFSRNPNNNFNLRGLKASLPESGFQQSVFQRYAHQGLDIDTTQLQSLLNPELLKGPPGDFFLDKCWGIVALMDLKVNERLDQEEFKRLWRHLVNCQYVFQNTQKSSGVLLSSDLWKVIENANFLAGISDSRELLDLMTLQYSDSACKVSFPSLVCFLIQLETMAKASHNLSKDGKELYLTEMEWINLVMYS